MTDSDLRTPDLADFEQEFSSSPIGALAVSEEAADLLFRQAATAYSFSEAPVTDAQVRAVYDLLQWGPTAMNSQPLRVTLVRSEAARARLVEHLGGGNKERTAAAPLVALLSYDVDFHNELDRTFPVFPNARDMFADEAARTPMAHTNAVLQAGYFVVAARAAGLVAGPMTGFDADGVNQEFFPDGRHQVFMVVNLGHAAKSSYRPRQPRLDYDEVVNTI